MIPGERERGGDLLITSAPTGVNWEDEGRGSAPPTPMLHLDGFDGPMDLLLDLAERQRIDLGRLSILTLVEQYLAAFETLRREVALERRADWLVIASRLVLLRSRLLFAESPEAAQVAAQDAAAEVSRLSASIAMRAAVAWFETRPTLGQDVFARGASERVGTQIGTAHQVDVIAFLWASLALFDDDQPDPDTTVRYRPVWEDLHSVVEARDRILRVLGEGGDRATLDSLLPEIEGGQPGGSRLRISSAWATTLCACLELAKQGEVALAQGEAFGAVDVSATSRGPSV